LTSEGINDCKLIIGHPVDTNNWSSSCEIWGRRRLLQCFNQSELGLILRNSASLTTDDNLLAFRTPTKAPKEENAKSLVIKEETLMSSTGRRNSTSLEGVHLVKFHFPFIKERGGRR